MSPSVGVFDAGGGIAFGTLGVSALDEAPPPPPHADRTVAIVARNARCNERFEPALIVVIMIVTYLCATFA
jgi:hypothetical protein